MKIHEKYINRCIEIANNGLGTTAPNPMVGSVIVYNNLIIGEGFTSPFGGSHAEVNAIQSVADKALLKEATLYVTLEPCSHFGKTPPCSNLIIEHGIPQVVIGTVDTHSKVAGNGIKNLIEAGCKVTVGVLEDECQEHHKRFFTFHNKKRPYIILKWAETADGFIAPKTRDAQKPVWITNEFSRQLVHKWRTEEHAILVGTNTVTTDNPSLTVRDWTGRNPIRIVLDRQQKLSNALHIFNGEAETIHLTKNEINFNKPLAHQIGGFLHRKNIQSVIIEGGLQTLQTFINEDIWDEARVFTGKSTFLEGTKAPSFSGELNSETAIMDDMLHIYRNKSAH
ncbi:bifunctional diaminohydroxyphosphoribosylaminopyrimidine deaminase/5-amino-6-(5-phosphoribosylamino)uracil reductase RibD [Bizionia argentinensis JUB59]|uniref:Riboflavin biosynthesis protein RibD n=1 Tax=Bizionia argentinensis JUB59 TaxID=1046627 RepID=G2EGN5_9FLAO|nr:bifunctional diaminohydroxyphosphoribosylaminopyrimidine deaminase/5-amino-6-(5-phosphoribosylamino)uracil reductase RibD [Bizionia argentinensis]EGV42396.1 bifunctional diaminohydroxyphosphoribosylaminopyrimidine deaminase/5-amino-6-(5-phosphoribosylamino)uracil reductase RibD [Bizionia argentinensis JUB59]